MAELRDPNGTIWEHAKRLQDENDRLKKEEIANRCCNRSDGYEEDICNLIFGFGRKCYEQGKSEMRERAAKVIESYENFYYLTHEQKFVGVSPNEAAQAIRKLE